MHQTQRLLIGCPRKNHAKGATAYITDLVHTLHTGITWIGLGLGN